MADQPPDKPPARSPAPSTEADDGPGRLAEDDRGNITWEWANEDVLQADDTVSAIECLRALVDPRLDIVEEGSARSPNENPLGLKVGYNPYDSGSLGRTARRRKVNLHELSKWLETQRKLEKKKDE
jgi:hypothetical protein